MSRFTREQYIADFHEATRGRYRPLFQLINRITRRTK